MNTTDKILDIILLLPILTDWGELAHSFIWSSLLLPLQASYCNQNRSPEFLHLLVLFAFLKNGKVK